MAVVTELDHQYILGHDDFYNMSHPDLENLMGVTDEDASWMHDNVPQLQALREKVTDDGPYSAAADIISQIMTEFIVEGSNFQPSAEPDLREWLAQVIRQNVSEITDDEIEDLISTIDDFPPSNQPRNVGRLALSSASV